MADIKELKQVRLEKMNKLIDNNINVHPERYEITHTLKDVREQADGTKDVSIAGRVMSKRKLGKISFIINGSSDESSIRRNQKSRRKGNQRIVGTCR